MNDGIKVTVFKFPDRRALMLRWRDPETVRLRLRSAKTNRRREAERAAVAVERDLAAGKCIRTMWPRRVSELG